MVARVVANKTVVARVVAKKKKGVARVVFEWFYAQKIACTSGCKKKGVVATVVAKKRSGCNSGCKNNETQNSGCNSGCTKTIVLAIVVANQSK